MAGKRQHVIPQFLQEGFTTSNARGRSHTWVFRRDTPPFKSNIVNVGVEGRFYTDDGDTEADDLITAAEGEFSTLVHALRAGTVSSLSDPRLPQLITHLETRTRHFRENFLYVGNFIVSEFLDFMSKEDVFADWLIRKIGDDPTIIHEACAQELSDQRLPQGLFEPLVKLSTILGPSLIELHKKSFRGLSNALRPILTERLVEQVKLGHLKALKRSVAPQMKVGLLGALSYNVFSVNKASLILGDSVVVFHVDGIRPYKTILEQKDRLKAVYMPLDSKKVLVGASEKFTTLSDNLPEVFARCSLEHFIAADNLKEHQALQDLIGNDARLFTDEEMGAVIEDVLGGN